jgi:rhodanese-related sulfurtransferase
VSAAAISIDELRTALEAADARPFIVDIGSRLAQQSRPHIPGAALLDLDAVAKLDDFPGDRDIVVYCACPNEASARRAAQILHNRGFKRGAPAAGRPRRVGVRGTPGGARERCALRAAGQARGRTHARLTRVS